MKELKIGENIKLKRRERDFTQEELAGMLGVTKAAVSKWENGESYPDVTMLPRIAELFHMTMDELFGYELECKPMKVINRYTVGLGLDNVDKAILEHGTVTQCGIHKIDGDWQVGIQLVSEEEGFPYILQKYIKPGTLADGYSYRYADGKIIDDGEPNKFYVCREKVWKYRIPNMKFVKAMIKEQAEMGLIDADKDDDI